MSYLDTASGQVVSQLPAAQRAGFIRRTYMHLAGSIGLFALLEAQLIQMGLGEKAIALLQTSRWSWLIVLAAFMLVGVVADRWARSSVSRELQYAGLGIFIIAEALVFLPLIYIALNFAPQVLPNAALITGALVGGLTLVAFTTRKDFSFLAPAMAIGGVVAMAIIVASIAFGFTLGTFFSAAMIIFSAGSVLYTTSNIIHVYREEQHVAAALSLFSSVALMFWYVVQLLMSFGDD